MNRIMRSVLFFAAFLLCSLVFIAGPVSAGAGNGGMEGRPGGLGLFQATDTVDTPTETLPPETTEMPSERPLVVVQSYSSSAGSISANQQFDLVIKLRNIGTTEARNLIASFPVGDVVPRETGGVVATTELDPGENKKFEQSLTATY